MKAILLFFSFATFLTPLYARQDREEDHYAVLEAVVKRENPTGIFAQVNNGSLLEATDSLRSIAADTLINFDDATRQNFIGQLDPPAFLQWDSKKIYHAKVVARDLVREIVSSAVDRKIATAFQPIKDRTVKIHRMSLPLFFGSRAMICVEFERLIILNDAIVTRDGYRRMYFLSADKKPGRWKVTDFVSVNL